MATFILTRFIAYIVTNIETKIVKLKHDYNILCENIVAKNLMTVGAVISYVSNKIILGIWEIFWALVVPGTTKKRDSLNFPDDSYWKYFQLLMLWFMVDCLIIKNFLRHLIQHTTIFMIAWNLRPVFRGLSSRHSVRDVLKRFGWLEHFLQDISNQIVRSLWSYVCC